MNELSTHIKATVQHRRIKMHQLEQSLTLPKIPEKFTNVPHSSAKSRKKATTTSQHIKSETTLTSDQENLHDQIKRVLGPLREENENKKTESRVNLPRVNWEEPRKKRLKEKWNYRKYKSEEKLSLKKILQDPYYFAEEYFADINRKIG